MNAIIKITTTGLLATLLMACGQSSAPPAVAVNAPPMEPGSAGARDFGNYTLQYSAITTDTLTPEIARNYNIQRSASRGLLNISVLKKQDGAASVPVAAKVDAQAVNMTGQFKGLSVREVRDGPAIYYIGDVSVSDEETLVFTVNATPEGETTPLSVRFQREYYVD